jgi:hypothetical protein
MPPYEDHQKQKGYANNNRNLAEDAGQSYEKKHYVEYAQRKRHEEIQQIEIGLFFPQNAKL